MQRFGWLFALLAISLTLAGCGRGGTPPAQAGPASVRWNEIPAAARLYYDNGGGIRDSLRLVVTDDATYRAVWSQATAAQSNPPAPPAVDFQREMLILVGAGRRTPEDVIRVDSIGIHPGGSRMSVIVRLAEGCSRLAIDAYPVEIVRVERFPGPVEFTDRRERALDCR